MPENEVSTGSGAAAEVIVALGASAASMRSVERFLTQFVLQNGMAAVVILQHREALDETGFNHALGSAGRELTSIENDAPVEAGRIYLPPSNVIVTVEDGQFRTRPAEQSPGERGTIDSFLVSLAQNENTKTVAVLFSGTGADGTLGVTAVKEAGGLALAEETDEHVAGGLIGSNSPAAISDFVLAPDELAERATLFVRHLVRQDDGVSEGPDPAQVSAALASIATVLRNKTGHDFHGYKQGTFLRRIHRRMQVVQADDVESYLGVLRAQPDEAQNLFNDLLIGVTQFFRDRREFELLENQIVPKLFEGKTRDDQLRVWVIGCSTGEEAYSVAILLREYMSSLDETPQVQIFATDIDGRALAAARAGRYTEAIANDLSPERIARWFIKEGNTYVVGKELREMCIFSQHSVIKDAPFSRLDMVSCRNLLIYLDVELQSRVIPLFHFALKPGGFLFLGNSENLSRHTSLFAPIENRFRIFRRVETGTRILPEFPFTAIDRRLIDAPTVPRPHTVQRGLSRIAERVAARHTPAFVIADESFNVLHFSGRTGRYIDPAGGAASLNLLNLVHSDLRLDLRAALTRAAEQNQPVEITNLRMDLNGYRMAVDLVVEPTQDSPGSPRSFVVLFKDGAVVPADSDSTAPDSSVLRDEHVQRLEAELGTTREQLQATIEELESTNEELKSANEEYQSLNEELQSANEELETSKEELQSINEELTTVNGELAHRVQELGRSNSDLKNLLESTQIATIFLDNELRVMNYTPAVTEVFHIVETDIGRPISHIKPRLVYDGLQEDVRRVLRTLGSVEHEVENPATGMRYMARVLPYRSIDNYIGGAVLTFVNITPLSRAQQALRESEERFRAVADLVPDLLWSSDPSGSADWFNRRWLEFTGRSIEAAQGFGWIEAVHPEDREESLRNFRSAVASGKPFVQQHRIRGKDGSHRWFLARAEPRRDEAGRIIQWLGAITDIHDQRTALDTLRDSESRTKLLLAELQHRVRNTLAVIRSIARRTATTSETVDDYAAHLDGRLDAYARVQAVVTRDPTAGIDLEQLVADELLAHAAHEGEQVTRIEGPPIRLQPKAAETMALAVHELATNAVKYGALSAEDGHVKVTWTIEQADGAPPRLVFSWSETGVELSGEAPTRRGFGTELIERTLAYQLEAEASLRFGPDGVNCTIALPLNDVITTSDGR